MGIQLFNKGRMTIVNLFAIGASACVHADTTPTPDDTSATTTTTSTTTTTTTTTNTAPACEPPACYKTPRGNCDKLCDDNEFCDSSIYVTNDSGRVADFAGRCYLLSNVNGVNQDLAFRYTQKWEGAAEDFKAGAAMMGTTGSACIEHDCPNHNSCIDKNTEGICGIVGLDCISENDLSQKIEIDGEHMAYGLPDKCDEFAVTFQKSYGSNFWLTVGNECYGFPFNTYDINACSAVFRKSDADFNQCDWEGHNDWVNDHDCIYDAALLPKDDPVGALKALLTSGHNQTFSFLTE